MHMYDPFQDGKPTAATHATKAGKKRAVCAIYLWFGDDCVDNLNCLCIRSIKMGMWWM